MLHSSMPAMLRLAREDTDRQVAMVTLEALRDVMEKVKAPALQGGGGPDNVISLVKDVLQHKVCISAIFSYFTDFGPDAKIIVFHVGS